MQGSNFRRATGDNQGQQLFHSARLSAVGQSDILSAEGLLMVDIHCHILPALDDGANSLDEALEMAEMAIEDGITHVVATPHANGEYRFDSDLVRERRSELQATLGDRLTLGIGCDFHLSVENLEEIRASPTKFSINHKRYLLVEFADFAIPPSTE